MKPIAGINRDTSPLDQPQATYRHAENILLTKLNGAVSVEPGFAAEHTRAGYILVGVIPVRDEEAVLFYMADDFQTNASYLSQIVYLDNNGDATLILQHADLKFTAAHPLKGAYYYDPSGDLIIAWTDNTNPVRILNVTSPEFTGTTPDARYIKRLSLFPDVVVPSIETQISYNEIGSIKNGAYVFYIAYEIEDDSITNYVGGTGSFLVGTGDELDGTSSEALKFDIANLDTNYDYYRLYAIRMTGGTKTGHYLLRRKVTTTGTDTVTWSGAQLGTVSDADIVINNTSYDTAKTLTVLNDRLHLGNVTAKNFFDYQPYANNITAKWTFQEERPDINTYESRNNAEVYGNHRGFMPGATYAFYIAFTLKDGTYSPAFHIPGREATDQTIFDGIGNGTGLRYCDINDYSSYDGKNTSDLTPAGNANSYWFGDMSITRNEDEYYPDTDSWDVKNASGTTTGTSLRGQRVRHHKFPSIQALEIHSNGYMDTDAWNEVYGIRFNNIPIPSELEEVATGYTIFYAARDFGNMDVVAYVPVLAWNFQDTANWDDGATYTQPCVSTAACNEYSVENYSFAESATISYTTCSGQTETATFPPDSGGFVYASATPTVTSGNATIALEEAGTGTNCEIAKIPSGKMRIYDPTIMAKKPELSQAYVLPEWYNNDVYLNSVTNTLTTQTSLASKLGTVQYTPANNIAADNKEREECAYLQAPGIIAGPYLGRGEGLYRGVNGHIGNEIVIGSLRQRIPNIYPNYASQALASTSSVYVLGDLSTNPYATSSGTGYLVRTTSIMGGDMSIERFRVRYMSKEDEGDTSIYDAANPDYPTSSYTNWLGYNYFKDNDNCRTVRHFEYSAPSRLPASKMYEDEGLAPTLTSRSISYYTGGYLNQYLLNKAYETINTFKPAFTFNDLNAEFITNFPTRIARSIVQPNEASRLQWRKFRALDYYEHLKTKGDIVNLEEYNGELIIHHEQSIFKTIGKDQIAGAETEVYLGTGDIFSLPPREIIDTPLGYAGTQHLGASKLFKIGYFFIDQEQRKTFLVSDGLNEISAKGLRNWYMDNLEFKLRNQLNARSISEEYGLWDAVSHPFGCGFTVAYDERYNRIIVAKKGIKFSEAGYAKLASGAQHELPLQAGKYYIHEGRIKLAAYEGIEVVLQELTTLTGDFDLDSWTYSYSPAVDAWVSEHTYLPTQMWNTRNRLFSTSGDTIYKHHAGANGVYYTGTPDASMIDIVFNPSPGATKVYSNFNWITESVNSAEQVEKKDTFTHATVYNSYQLSNRISLVDQTNMRESEGTWKFNTFRDLADGTTAQLLLEDFSLNYGVLNTSLPWHRQRRFIDKYTTLRLEYNNVSGNTLYLYEVSPAVRISNR